MRAIAFFYLSPASFAQSPGSTPLQAPQKAVRPRKGVLKSSMNSATRVAARLS